MAGGRGLKADGVLDRLVLRRSMARWRRLADAAYDLDLARLKVLRGQARSLRRHLDRVLHAAEGRLALPLVGAPAIRRPPGADWVWRPDAWTGPIPVHGAASLPMRTDLGGGVTVFHDCRVSELCVRQIRNTRPQDLAPFGLALEVFRFDGTFLSVVLDLPEAAVTGLRLRHVIRVETIVETEKSLEIFARLNVRHGPNVEQTVQQLPQGAAEAVAEFDLAYTRINEKRVEKAWVDLIFEAPQMNRIVLRDVTLLRRPRADL